MSTLKETNLTNRSEWPCYLLIPPKKSGKREQGDGPVGEMRATQAGRSESHSTQPPHKKSADVSRATLKFDLWPAQAYTHAHARMHAKREVREGERGRKQMNSSK